MFELMLLDNLFFMIDNNISLESMTPDDFRSLLKMTDFGETDSFEERVKSLTLNFVAKHGTLEAIYLLKSLEDEIRNLRFKYLGTRTDNDLTFLIIACQNSIEKIEKLLMPLFSWTIYKHFNKLENGSFERENFINDITKNVSIIFNENILEQETFYEMPCESPSIGVFIQSVRSYREITRQIKKVYDFKKLEENLNILFGELTVMKHKYKPIILKCFRDLSKDIRALDKKKRANKENKQLTLETI